jgi:hypothetical protein
MILLPVVRDLTSSARRLPSAKMKTINIWDASRMFIAMFAARVLDDQAAFVLRAI